MYLYNHYGQPLWAPTSTDRGPNFFCELKKLIPHPILTSWPNFTASTLTSLEMTNFIC